MAGKAEPPPDLAAPGGHRDRIQELGRGLLGKHLEADAHRASRETSKNHLKRSAATYRADRIAGLVLRSRLLRPFRQSETANGRYRACWIDCESTKKQRTTRFSPTR